MQGRTDQCSTNLGASDLLEAGVFVESGLCFLVERDQIAHVELRGRYGRKVGWFCSIRVLAILFCWVGKHVKYYYETDELPNPRPAQPKKNWAKSGIWATFPSQEIVFRGLGLVLYRKQTTRKPTQPSFLQTPCWFVEWLVGWMVD